MCCADNVNKCWVTLEGGGRAPRQMLSCRKRPDGSVLRRNIIPIGDVIAVNQMLERRGSALRVHMHDACGGQSFSLRADDGTSADEASRQAVGEFFSARGHAVEFSAGGSDFWAVRP